jgi:PAS domain S-box-containing protein
VDPTAVLVVGGTETGRRRVRSVVAGGTATEVLTAPAMNSAVSTLAGRDDVGCVLLLVDADPGVDAADHVANECETLRADSDGLPLLVVADDADVAGAVATRRHCRYLPRSVSDERLVAAVDDALATYDERRRERAESSLFRTLLAESNVPIYAKDDRGRHLYKSDLQGDLQDPADMVGKTDLDLAEEGYLDAARDTYADDATVIQSGEGLYEQEERAGRGDDEYWSLTTKVPWRDDAGDVQGLVGFSFDITRWKERERRLEAERRRIDRFTKYLAHDLRTPLQVAYGALDAAREGDESAFGKVEDAHDRMRTIVEDLRGISSTPMRLGAGYDAVSVGLASTHLVALVEEVWQSIGGAERSLSVELPEDTLVVARVGVVRPLVETLLRNAVEHGGPDVAVTVGSTHTRGFFIADDGPGFPEAVSSALRGETAEDSEALGPGLLAVIDTVEQQGWELSVGESPSGGARIAVTNCPVVTNTLADADSGEPVPLTESRDVGAATCPGSADYDAETDTWRVTGGGRDVWGDTHEFHLVSGTTRSPVRVQGRITDLDAAHEYSKAGFLVRGGPEADAPFGYVGTTGDHGSETTWRLSRDGHTSSTQFEERPEAFNWYRIEYADGNCTCYLSADGEEWRPVDQRSVDLGAEVTVGLMVCSHSAEETAEATFRSVSACRLDT